MDKRKCFIIFKETDDIFDTGQSQRVVFAVYLDESFASKEVMRMNKFRTAYDKYRGKWMVRYILGVHDLYK